MQIATKVSRHEENWHERIPQKGMVANVRFMITKRSLFDILYQNIDEWINPTQYITE